MMMVKPELSQREAEALERARRKADLVHWLRREAAARDGEMAWYVARTRWNADSVEKEVRAAGIEAVCPLYRIWKRYPRSTHRFSVEMPLLGNHLFVRLLKAENAWVGMMSFDGVECLLGTGEKPLPMRDSEVSQVLAMVGETCGKPEVGTAGLAVGDTVLHPLGTFAELRGIVCEIDAGKREALISTVLFGREIETRCGIDDLEKLS